MIVAQSKWVMSVTGQASNKSPMGPLSIAIPSFVPKQSTEFWSQIQKTCILTFIRGYGWHQKFGAFSLMDNLLFFKVILFFPKMERKIKTLCLEPIIDRMPMFKYCMHVYPYNINLRHGESVIRWYCVSMKILSTRVNAWGRCVKRKGLRQWETNLHACMDGSALSLLIHNQIEKEKQLLHH